MSAGTSCCSSWRKLDASHPPARSRQGRNRNRTCRLARRALRQFDLATPALVYAIKASVSVVVCVDYRHPRLEDTCIRKGNSSMRMHYWSLGLIAVVVGLSSTGLFAASPRLCPTGPPTAASYTWNFPREASGLLVQMKDDAVQVRSIADKLDALDRDPFDNFWQYDATLLNSARTRANAMDGMLCRLETIRRVSSPWEKQAISRVAPSVVELSDSTQAAIHYLNHNQEALMFPAYTNQAAVMYNKANRIVNFVDQYQKYVSERTQARVLRHDAHQLGTNLGVTS